MSQDEWYLVDLRDILVLFIFSGKALHYSVPMTSLVMSLMMSSVLPKAI